MVNARGACVLATLLVVLSCRKNAPSGSGVDGGDASLQDGASSQTAAPSESVAAASVTDGPQLRPAPSATSSSLFPVTAGPFDGTYRCFKGLQLVQTGAHVLSTTHTNATTDTVIACTVAGDVCAGSIREVQHARGKPPKVLHVKPMTLERTPAGDVLFKPGSPTEKPTFCKRQ
jgi:hypothetical protein